MWCSRYGDLLKACVTGWARLSKHVDPSSAWRGFCWSSTHRNTHLWVPYCSDYQVRYTVCLPYNACTSSSYKTPCIDVMWVYRICHIRLPRLVAEIAISMCRYLSGIPLSLVAAMSLYMLSPKEIQRHRRKSLAVVKVACGRFGSDQEWFPIRPI